MEQVKLWTVKQVAEFLACSESWVRHAAAAGRIPSRKIGGLLRFVPSEIEALARGDAGQQPRANVIVRGLTRSSSAA